MNTDAALVAQLEREIDALNAKYDALYESTRTIQTSVQQFVAVSPQDINEVLIGGTIPADTLCIFYNGPYTCEIQPTSKTATYRTLTMRFKMWSITTAQCGDVTTTSAPVSTNLPALTVPFSMDWGRNPDDGLWIPIVYQNKLQYQRYYYDYSNNSWVAAEIEETYTLTGSQMLLSPCDYGFVMV